MGIESVLFKASYGGALLPVLLVLGVAALIYVLYRVIKSRKVIRRDKNSYSTVGLESDDYGAIAAAILEGLGGKKNVTHLESCITRLRLKIKDYTEVDEKKIRATGVPGIMRPDKNTVHLIIGKNVKLIADELSKLL